MITARAAKLLWDAREAGRNAVEFMAGRDENTYRADRLIQSAVERQCEIVGEALAVLNRTFPDVARRIPDVRRIIGFRNVLVHEYDAIRGDIVWRAVAVDLPPLIETLSLLLAEAPQP